MALGRRISKTRSQTLNGQPQSRRVTTRFVWERFRLLQEIHDEVPLTYVYSDEGSYDPLARIDGSENPEIYGFHNQPNGTPERLTDVEGQLRWEGQNSAWGKLLRESSLQAQDLRRTCVCKANTSTAKPACTLLCFVTTIRIAGGLPSRTR